jgi:thioredoxin reductase (NADPH)
MLGNNTLTFIFVSFFFAFLFAMIEQKEPKQRQKMEKQIENVVIIGSGPAAHTCAIYLGRELLSPLMFEGDTVNGIPAGGLLMTTTAIENFPGFVSIQGQDLMEEMRKQSLKNGTRIETETVTRIDTSTWPFRVFIGSDDRRTILTKTIVIATGSYSKRLHVPGEDDLFNFGVSTCAVCDGALPCFRNKNLVVVGGGDSAMEEAHFLTKFAQKVYLLVRSEKLRASKAMQERVLQNPKIEICYNTNLTKVESAKDQKQLSVVHIETNKIAKSINAAGLFYAIGHVPNTDFLMDQKTKLPVISLNSHGEIVTVGDGSATSVPGVFSAGDVQDRAGKYRQAITAAGSGYVAAYDVRHFLESHK